MSDELWHSTETIAKNYKQKVDLRSMKTESRNENQTPSHVTKNYFTLDKNILTEQEISK